MIHITTNKMGQNDETKRNSSDKPLDMLFIFWIEPTSRIWGYTVTYWDRTSCKAKAFPVLVVSEETILWH